MGECGDARAIPALSEAMKDRSLPEEVRGGGLYGLGRLRETGFFGPVQALLHNRSETAAVRARPRGNRGVWRPGGDRHALQGRRGRQRQQSRAILGGSPFA